MPEGLEMEAVVGGGLGEAHEKGEYEIGDGRTDAAKCHLSGAEEEESEGHGDGHVVPVAEASTAAKRGVLSD